MGTVPVLPAWAVNEDITAADLQSMSDAVTWDFATRPVFYASQAVVQSGWTTATFTAITFTTEVIDRDGQHSTTVNTSRVVIGGTLGFYRVSGCFCAAQNSAATVLRSAIFLNGAGYPGGVSSMVPATGTSNTMAIATPTVIIQATAATDYVEVMGFVTAASGTLGTLSSGGFSSSLCVEWIGS